MARRSLPRQFIAAVAALIAALPAAAQHEPGTPTDDCVRRVARL